jgi:hypothetical protein
MDVFTELFGNLLAFVYHCFDRIVIHGYLSALSRPEQVVHFVRKVVGVPVVSKEILSQRGDSQARRVEERLLKPGFHRRDLAIHHGAGHAHEIDAIGGNLLQLAVDARADSVLQSCLEQRPYHCARGGDHHAN